MILRKPYAFLIKHFRLIHLILTGIYIYLAIKVNILLNYYNDYISGIESKLNAIKYITNFYLVAIIISIIICLIIFALMRYKKKPKLLYYILMILYIIVAIIINVSYTGLDKIYISSLDAKTLRLYRDFLRIILMFQYLSIALTAIRGLGFDIKKFNFKQDIDELQLDITDDEEVELTLGNTEGIKRRIRRTLRELKYYYKENKLYLNIIFVVIVILLLSTITISKEVINKIYKEKEIISTDAFNLSVKNSYITNKNSTGELIASDDTTFLIIKLQITPKSTQTQLNDGNLVLKIDNNNYKLEKRYYANFNDIGSEYEDRNITQESEYIFIFNIPDNSVNKKMQLIYAGDKKINLSPVNLDKTTKTKTAKITETLDLSTSSLGSGSITINSININQKFPYSYNYELNGKVNTINRDIASINNTIMNIKIKSTLPFNLTNYDLISKYGQIKYIKDNEEITSNVLSDRTPNNYKKGLYLEVDKDIESSPSIKLELTIRNTNYIYTLK